MSRENLFYESVEDKQTPSDYRVEAIGHDGEVYVAIFSGPDAHSRADDYAEWQNSRQLAKAS